MLGQSSQFYGGPTFALSLLRCVGLTADLSVASAAALALCSSMMGPNAGDPPPNTMSIP